MLRRISFVVLCLCASAAACGGPDEYAIVGTARAPGSDGAVQFETIEGGNTLVTVAVDHLPPVERLGADLRAYVVWFVPPGQPPVKAGILEYDPDARTGRMMATTPHRRFTLKITAEVDASADSPSDVVVAARDIGESD